MGAGASSSGSPWASPRTKRQVSGIGRCNIRDMPKQGWQQGSTSELLMAADSGRLQDVRRMLANGADVNQKHPPNRMYGDKKGAAGATGSPAFNPNVTPLMVACRNGHFEVAKVLVEEYNADLDAVDLENWCALHYACTSAHHEIAKFLVDKGCDQEVKSAFEKATPMDFARHRRFGEVCLALGDDHALGPLSHGDQTGVVAQSKMKLDRALADGEPLLHRYQLTTDQWDELKRFLDRVAAPDLTVKAYDEVLEEDVTIRWTGDLAKHRAEATALIAEGKVVLRYSSVCAVQHFTVRPEEAQAEEIQKPVVVVASTGCDFTATIS